MNKLLIAVAALTLFSFAAFAQSSDTKYDHSDQFFISVQGGPLYTFGDNFATYFDEGCPMKLFNPFGAISAGYSFDTEWTVRLSVTYGRNDYAYNMLSYPDVEYFAPYKSKSLSCFADVIIDIKGIKGLTGRWSPKIYGGIGLGYTWDVVDNFVEADQLKKYSLSSRPAIWTATDKNLSFGYRFGAILEYDFGNNISAFADFCGEFYVDNYSGLDHTKEYKKTIRPGYPQFPFDVRGVLAFGLNFYF